MASTPSRWQVPRNLHGVLSVALTQTSVGRSFAARRWATTIARRAPRAAPPVEQIAIVGCPIALVHGTADRSVPIAAARELHAAAGAPCSIDIVAGMGHGYGAAAIAPIVAAVSWIADHAGDDPRRGDGGA